MKNMDFVYLIKQGDPGKDLRYSLRGISKWYPESKVWIVGYKPKWCINVNYMPIKETNKKWKNLVNNLIAVCENPEISEDFIYMNDDFFAINPTWNLDELIESNMGLLSEQIAKYKKSKKPKNVWQKAFEQVDTLMNSMNMVGPFYNYESHTPLRINKQKFLEVIKQPEVQAFIKTPNTLHYRTLYKNWDKPENITSLCSDVKVLKAKDNSRELLNVCGWLSTADDLVDNPQFFKLNHLLQASLSNKCKYEGIAEKKNIKKDRFVSF